MGEGAVGRPNCECEEGVVVPSGGSVFEDHNRNGEHGGSSQGKVIEAEPGRAFAFECSMMDFHFSTWGYRIEPTADGCRVTEWSEDLRPESVMEFSNQMSGVDDRTARNRATMSAPLRPLAPPQEPERHHHQTAPHPHQRAEPPHPRIRPPLPAHHPDSP